MFGALGRESLILGPHLHGRLCSRNRWREYQILIHSLFYLWQMPKWTPSQCHKVFKIKSSKVFKKNLLMAFREKCQDSKMRFLFSVLTVWSVRISDLGQGLALATWHYLECLSTIKGRAIVWIIHLQPETAVMTRKMIGLTVSHFLGQWARLQAAIQMEFLSKVKRHFTAKLQAPSFGIPSSSGAIYMHCNCIQHDTSLLRGSDGWREWRGNRCKEMLWWS